MLNPAIKSKANDLHNKVLGCGMPNPRNAIEQISHFLFLKQLNENDISLPSPLYVSHAPKELLEKI